MSADPYDDLQPATPLPPEVFISYARRDYDKVRPIADQLAALGVSFWLDQHEITGGENYAAAIARGIKLSRVVVLMCSDAALRSRDVNKEIILAWQYGRPYLPLLLERVSFPEQVEYFLAGVQWIEVLDSPATQWLPRLQRALTNAGVSAATSGPLSAFAASPLSPVDISAPRFSETRSDLSGLRALASFNDCIWPIAAGRKGEQHAAFRGLGAPQQGVQHGHRIGSRLALAIQAERAGHLLLIDEGPEGIIYCLCPSWFAPNTQIEKGVNYLPQVDSHYQSFEVSGKPGREQLLAIITDEPLALNWIPPDSNSPARVLSAQDVEFLLNRLQQLDATSWVALATYFDIVG